MSTQDDSLGAAIASVAPIAAIQGASNRTIQEAMRRFALRRADLGVHIAGLIETFNESAEPARQAVRLQNIQSGKSYPLFQNLGRMATAYHLQGAGIVAACVDICAEIEAGCDLVILSKFGQLEVLRSGLIDAFIGAVVVAFSRAGDPAIGEFEDAVVLKRFCEVDEGLLAGQSVPWQE